MRPSKQGIVAHLRLRAAAYLVLCISLIPLGITYWRVQVNVRSRDEARFKTIAQRVESTIRDNLDGLTADLRAVSGFLEASTDVSQDEWQSFLRKLELDTRHPGIRSVGFLEKVTPATQAAFVQRMRRELSPDFDIWPALTRPLSFPAVRTTYFPNDHGPQYGWDFYSDTPRRAALDFLLSTRRPAITSKVSFWIENRHDADGFTIFVPVERASTLPRTTVGPDGAVYSSFIPQRLFNTLSNRAFDSTVSVELFDGQAAEKTNLLASFGAGSRAMEPAFSETRPIRLMDHVFQLRVETLPGFDMLSEKQLPRAVLACGLAFCALLFGIAWLQASSRSAAEKLNERLRESEERVRAANTELERRISDAKTAEGMLAHERDLLRTFLDHSPDAVYFKDRDSRFIKCGKAVLAYLGLHESDNAGGKTDFDFFTEEHARPAFEMEQEIMRTGQPVIGLVEKEVWKDGRESWVLTSKMPLRDKYGNIIGTCGISKDITKLKETELALEKEKDLLTVTLGSIADGVITTDVEGRIVLFNGVAEQIIGCKQADAVGKYLRDVFRTRGTEGDTEIIRRTISSSAPRPARDAILVTPNGEKNISESVAPIIDREGQNIGAVLVFRDVTEKLKTEAELLKASKLESIGVLAGGIAHDFNNILTVILGNISLARMAHSAGLPLTEPLAEAENASLRARELTQRLLTFAKGGAPIKKPLDLSRLIRDCVVHALQDTEITPEFFIGDGLWTVEADESQIGQVVQNLINYVRTSIGKDPRLDIHVLNQEITSDPLLLLKPGKYVRVSIRDYGAGIQPENLTKIFEPYFGSRRQGSGLELATAYSIVRKHEGQIRVESISGQGTVFHIYLPATAALNIPLRSAPVVRSEKKLISRRVLVMDDELPIRKLAAQLLKRIGCTAVTAADGAEAIELYEKARANGEPFDAVIMDLTVPNGLGGKETIRQLRALDPNVIAIVSSGYSNDPVMADFREYGFAGVVPKPYSTEDLVSALSDLFDP